MNLHPIKILTIVGKANMKFQFHENMEMISVPDCKDALTALENLCFDICIWEVNFSDRYFRLMTKKLSSIPVIFIFNDLNQLSIATEIGMGFDDYIIKPFDFFDLQYRVSLLLNKRKQIPTYDVDILNIGAVEFYPKLRLIAVNNEQYKLSQRQTSLIYLLLQHSSNFVTRTEILKQLWGDDNLSNARSMDVHLTHIRKLLRKDPTVEIENLYGIGYRITQRFMPALSHKKVRA
jgi:two-component system OmpR family response regulator